MVSETSFLEEAKKLEEANGKLHNEIKEHERLEDELRKSEYRSLFESSRDAIMLLDKNGIFDCNKATLELFGFHSKEDFINKHPSDLSPATQLDGQDSLTAAVKHIENAYRDGTDFFEWLHTHQDGTQFNAEVLLSRMENQSRIVLQANVRDITARKRTEQELTKAQKIAEENALQQGRIEMSNNMMHDIGNALTGVSAYTVKPQTEKDWTEIMSLQKLNDLFASKEKELIEIFGEEKEKHLLGFIEALKSSLQQRNKSYIEFCEKIFHTVGHISSILELQKYYLKEKNTPLATVLNIHKMIEDALIILSGSLQKRNIAVKIATDGSNPNISGDQTRMMRMLLNILKNTYEAFDGLESQDSRRLDIKITSDMKAGEVIIMFSDNGAGFSPENCGKLFERGFSTKTNGSGIGLHECRAIIESHGGTIAIESKGQSTGAETTIKIPLLNGKKGQENHGSAI